MATDGGRAELITTGDDVSSLSRASSDTINGGGGNDTLSGDVLASGAGGQAVINGAGDDSIAPRAGEDLIVGDALARAGAPISLTDAEHHGQDTLPARSGHQQTHATTKHVPKP